MEMNECAMSCHDCRNCRCAHHKIVPALIAAIGLAFLLRTMGVVSEGAVNTLWPLLLMIIGIVKMTSGACRCYGNVPKSEQAK